ncbi:hypothetical protein [Kitasatospora viridis]|uniref:Uncharacterized protein n=1 Tax=Kitasatospora viridis TaxID=281105 RepID=A0A561UPY0_9ACTN|nr:hypothetical protein [Kitasatospora viridis]TWG01423.1 hypothetical protein FHX73_115316 [Kitasatospora viridis]
MSNSYARPILRTADLAEALATVARLLEHADTGELEVDFDARVPGAEALAPLVELVPNIDRWPATGGGGEAAVRVQAWGMPPELAGPLLAAVGGAPATLRWDFAGWLDAPAIGLGRGGSRGSYVTVCLNLRDLDLREPAPDHTVFVHVAHREAERAPWLAEQVGLAPIGELVMAPL